MDEKEAQRQLEHLDETEPPLDRQAAGYATAPKIRSKNPYVYYNESAIAAALAKATTSTTSGNF